MGKTIRVIWQKVKYNKYNTDPENNMSEFFNVVTKDVPPVPLHYRCM